MTGVDSTVTLPPFQTLLDEHAADLHRFLVASVGPHDGADCFQETVISALRAYPDLRHADNLRGWLFTIAHRKVVDHARRVGRHAVPVAEPPEVGVAADDPTPDGDATLSPRCASCPRSSARLSCSATCSTGRTPRWRPWSGAARTRPVRTSGPGCSVSAPSWPRR